MSSKCGSGETGAGLDRASGRQYAGERHRKRAQVIAKDLSAILAEIEALSLDDRIRLMHAIEEGIAAEAPAADLTDAQQRELNRRIAASDANPNDVISWEELKSRLRRRRA